MGDEDRASILARRARFIATALAGLVATTGGAPACEGDDDGVGAQAGAPQPCLDMGPGPTTGQGMGGAGGTPEPCLGVPLGGGGMSGAGGDGGAGGEGGSGG